MPTSEGISCPRPGPDRAAIRAGCGEVVARRVIRSSSSIRRSRWPYRRGMDLTLAEDPAVAAALLVLRVGVGAVMLAHGWNHVWGGGGIAGTTRWFAGLGMRPARLHAWSASLTELGAGALLVVGLLTPLAGAAVVGVMLVAWITNHAGNGFFIFRPGEGWEYVMILTLSGIAIAGLGAGAWSADAALGIRLAGTSGLLLAAGAGGGGAALLLALGWRRPPPAAEAEQG
jgi:putative oxidoreductase